LLLFFAPQVSILFASPLSNGKSHRVGSNYIRQLSGQMLVSHENIRLLECIGQGMPLGDVSITFPYILYV